ncbi:MAG: response regulator transcription factor [Tetrasphaera sp.]
MSAASGTGLTALVVDDEAPARSELRYLLERDERIGAIHVAASGTDALRLLDAQPIDVVYTDISMPGLDGMEFARILGRFAQRPALVFVTAHDRHAVDAFAVDAVDYVMKPVRPERLAEATRRAAALVAGSRSVESDAVPDETIPVELGGVTRFINRADIRYVLAHGDYARLHTDTGSHLVRISLASLAERWASAGFVRIHRSTLVAMPHVTEVRMDHGKCSVVVGRVELAVSRRHLRDVRAQLLRPRESP